MGQPRVLHHGGDVGKIQVDEARVPNQVRDGLHRLAQHVVGNLEGVGKCNLLVRGVLKPLVGDDDQRIHLGPKLLNAALGLLHPAAPLKAEGLGHHAHGENLLFLGQFRHNRSRAGARTAAHAGSDEDHIRLFQGLGNLVPALLSGLASHLRVRARALPVGQLFADLNFVGGAGDIQRLLVRVDRHKVHALSSGADHAVHYVISSAADADYLNVDNGIGTAFQTKCHSAASCYH